MLRRVVLIDVSEVLLPSLILDDGGSKYVRNICQFLRHYTVQHPRIVSHLQLHYSSYPNGSLPGTKSAVTVQLRGTFRQSSMSCIICVRVDRHCCQLRMLGSKDEKLRGWDGISQRLMSRVRVGGQ
jgi:hypothetical protein